MKTLFRKTIVLAFVAALGLAAMPLVSVSAAGEFDPLVPRRHIPEERLERIWARQLRIHERMGRADEFVENTQALIDRAQANGKDVSAVQSALAAFESALKEAQPIYDSMIDIVDSHQGFDQDGKVTDPDQARETIDAMREKAQEIKSVMNGKGKALHEAIQAFREANPRPQPAPTTTNG
jgi:hypothetical protein